MRKRATDRRERNLRGRREVRSNLREVRSNLREEREKEG